METAAQNKAWIAKTVGSCYFILLGFIYFIMEIVSGSFTWSDVAVLAWVGLPLLINKRWLYLIFGGLNLVIWSYAGLAVLVKWHGEPFTLLAVSLITLTSIFCALLLIYSALSISEKRFSLI